MKIRSGHFELLRIFNQNKAFLFICGDAVPDVLLGDKLR